MVELSQNSSSQRSERGVQNEDVEKLRSSDAGSESVNDSNSSTDAEARRSDGQVQSDREVVDKAAAEVAVGRQILERDFGVNAGSDAVARCFARFDPRQSELQPAEFYNFDDPEFDDFGYF